MTEQEHRIPSDEEYVDILASEHEKAVMEGLEGEQPTTIIQALQDTLDLSRDVESVRLFIDRERLVFSLELACPIVEIEGMPDVLPPDIKDPNVRHRVAFSIPRSTWKRESLMAEELLQKARDALEYAWPEHLEEVKKRGVYEKF